MPYNAKYYSYTEHSGKVDSITSVVQDEGKHVTDSFAVRLKDDPKIYTVFDTRISQYSAGDPVKFNCTLEWIYAGSDKYNCNILED